MVLGKGEVALERQKPRTGGSLPTLPASGSAFGFIPLGPRVLPSCCGAAERGGWVSRYPWGNSRRGQPSQSSEEGGRKGGRQGLSKGHQEASDLILL